MKPAIAEVPGLEYGSTVEVRPVAEKCPTMQRAEEQLARDSLRNEYILLSDGRDWLISLAPRLALCSDKSEELLLG
jgi:hypothetical protein